LGNVTAFIFARSGSKGVVNKNIREFAGKPLIAWSIEQALSSKRIDRVIVSTDSSEIAEISLRYGAEVPFLRPAELAADDSPELLAWKHALTFLEKKEGRIPEIFLSLPCTSPLRSHEDVEANLDCLISNKADLAICVSSSKRSPFFNLIKLSAGGEVERFQTDINYTRRQDVPQTFDVTTIAYSGYSKYILETSELFSGRIFASLINEERAIDIDSELDFQLAEFLFKKVRSQ
jgi:N-acylneuraminate cytidylyltransferase